MIPPPRAVVRLVAAFRASAGGPRSVTTRARTIAIAVQPVIRKFSAATKLSPADSVAPAAAGSAPTSEPLAAPTESDPTSTDSAASDRATNSASRTRTLSRPSRGASLPKPPSSPQEALARMAHHCRARRSISAWADYQWLVTHARETLTVEHVMLLLNTMRQRQATRSDVAHMVALVTHLEDLGADKESALAPAVEIVLVRAAQCKVPDVVADMYAKLAEMGEVRRPIKAAVLNVLKKTKRYNEAIALADKWRAAGEPVMFVYNRILMECEAERDHGPAGLSRARALFDEFIRSEESPDALAKAYGVMALLYVRRGDRLGARTTMQSLLDRRPAVPLTASCYHVLVKMAVLDFDLEMGRFAETGRGEARDKACAHLARADQFVRQEMARSQKPLFSMSVETVMGAHLRAGDEASARVVLDAYTARCNELTGRVRIKYAPFGVLVRHLAKDTERPEAVEHLFETIPGSPYLHDYAVVMVVDALLAAGQADRARTFLKRCIKRGYVPQGNKGYTLARFEKVVKGDAPSVTAAGRVAAGGDGASREEESGRAGWPAAKAEDE
ncbi:hypothetical protein GGF32_000276 [Allomyces javanicus]|nr:hypothetical protein GGF32_000276 [Allomyces javanicus]